MKKASVIPFLVPVTLCAALAIYNPGRAEAAFRIVGLPKTGDATQIETMLAGLALGLSPGDSMMVFDSLDGTSIGPTMTIPNDPTKSRPERRIADIIPTMAAVKKHLATMTPAKTGELDLINASAFFDSIAPIVADHSSEVVRILVLGAPSFTAPGQLESDKKYIGSFPSDGLILADRSRSPFGTKGKHDLRATVDYCYTGGQRNFLTPEDRERVERAWSLHIAQRGGQLTTFSGDIKTCFDRFAAQKAPEARKFEFDATDSTMQYMYRTQDTSPRIINAPPVKTEQSAPTPSASEMSAEGARFEKPARNTPPSTKTGAAWIGIQWKDPIDLDLYVRCTASSPFLFFANQHSPEGRHNFDYRAGTGTEFETVDLTAPCADITKAEVFVNFYSGTATASPKGVFAIEFDGGLYKANFEIPARIGNGGLGLMPTAIMGPPYWVKIDVPAVLKLDVIAATHPRNRSTR